MEKFGTFFHAKKGVNEKVALFLNALIENWRFFKRRRFSIDYSLPIRLPKKAAA